MTDSAESKDTTKPKYHDPEEIAKFLLRPVRVVKDPVHGDIWLTELESRIIDSDFFQRLRGIKQLATTYLVYPGAVHTRFEHSLGVLYLADKIIREARKNCEERGYLTGSDLAIKITEQDRFLVRLLALLHDAAHIPFGHLIEDEASFTDENQWLDTKRQRALLEELDKVFAGYLAHIGTSLKKIESRKRGGKRGEKGSHERGDNELSRPDTKHNRHDDCQSDCERALLNLCGDNMSSHTDCRGRIESFLENSKDALISALVAEEAGESSIEKLEKPFLADIVGNTICADLLDYLERDTKCAGINDSYEKRLLSYFAVVMSGGKPRMALILKRLGKGIRVDLANQIAKLLTMRYSLAQTVYNHRAKRRYSSFVTSAFGAWIYEYDSADMRRSAPVALNSNKFKNEVQARLARMLKDPAIKTDEGFLHHLRGLEGESRTSRLAQAVLGREKWHRIELSNLDVVPAEKEPEVKSEEVKSEPEVRLKLGFVAKDELVHSWNLPEEIGLTGSLRGQDKVLIELQIETLLKGALGKYKAWLQKQTQKKPVKEGIERVKKALSAGALVSLHAPKTYKSKEALVKILLMYEDPKHGGKSFVFSLHEMIQATQSDPESRKKSEMGVIGRILGDKSVHQYVKNRLESDIRNFRPLGRVLDGISQATQLLTPAELYVNSLEGEILVDFLTQPTDNSLALRQSLQNIVELYVAQPRTNRDLRPLLAKRVHDFLRDFEVVAKTNVSSAAAAEEPILHLKHPPSDWNTLIDDREMLIAASSTELPETRMVDMQYLLEKLMEG